MAVDRLPKESPLISRATLVKNIRQRLKDEYDISVKSPEIAKIIRILEDEIYAAIATEQAVKFVFGTIYGISKRPVPVHGCYTENDSAIRNHGWSVWKRGFPVMKFTKAAYYCDSFPPEDFFALPENKFTSAAAEFRKDAGLPDPPEFEGLTEEEKQEIIARADKIEFDALTRY